MKAAGCLFLILACVGIGIGVYINSQVANKLSALKKDVDQRCEKAVPIFERRYHSVEPLIKAYELKFGWENSTYVGDPRRFNQSWELLRSDWIEITQLTPELQCSRPVLNGMAVFKAKGPALSRIDGVTEVEHHLPALIAAATRPRYTELPTSVAMTRLPIAPSHLSADVVCSGSFLAADFIESF